MQADRRSALVSPESIETPPQTIIPVDEHGSSNIRACAGMRAVSTGLVCGEKHASGDNVTTTTKYRTLYRLMGCSLSIRSDLSAILPCTRRNALSHITMGSHLRCQYTDMISLIRTKGLTARIQNRPGTTTQLSVSEQILARKAPKPASTLGAAKRPYQ
jgi:hypothetical protein